MKLTNVFEKNKFSLSFEVFPPKTSDSFDSVKIATETIAKLKPSFISVTYGAGGGTSEYTLQIAKNIKENCGVTTLAHLTCVSSTKDTVKKQIQKMIEYGIDNVMALRGDKPIGFDSNAKLDYAHATDLIRELKNSNKDFCIGGACYPEIHPESVNEKDDIIHLKEKVDCGCDFLTTQMFFDNKLLYDFFEKTNAVGIKVPVIAGIMPITSAKQVERAVTLSNSYIPQKLFNLVDKFGQDVIGMKDAGIDFATEQIINLFNNGVKNVHVYTMNKPDVAERIQANLKGFIE